MRRIAIKVRDTIATSTGAARFSTNDEEFFIRVNRLLLDSSRKLTIIACIELDVSVCYYPVIATYKDENLRRIRILHGQGT